eukprot:scaffold3350_cov268-Pinguiococcus_pyrenoidosus.AAC.32
MVLQSSMGSIWTTTKERKARGIWSYPLFSYYARTACSAFERILAEPAPRIFGHQRIPRPPGRVHPSSGSSFIPSIGALSIPWQAHVACVLSPLWIGRRDLAEDTAHFIDLVISSGPLLLLFVSLSSLPCLVLSAGVGRCHKRSMAQHQGAEKDARERDQETRDARFLCLLLLRKSHRPAEKPTAESK